jgi:hypothetical protein
MTNHATVNRIGKAMPISLLICVAQFKLQTIAGSEFGIDKPTKMQFFL